MGERLLLNSGRKTKSKRVWAGPATAPGITAYVASSSAGNTISTLGIQSQRSARRPLQVTTAKSRHLGSVAVGKLSSSRIIVDLP
jgi:hypothetical protein